MNPVLADPASVYTPIFTCIILVPIMVFITIYCIKITRICSRAQNFKTKQPNIGNEGKFFSPYFSKWKSNDFSLDKKQN